MFTSTERTCPIFEERKKKKLVIHQMFLAKQFGEINVNESETCELYFS